MKDHIYNHFTIVHFGLKGIIGFVLSIYGFTAIAIMYLMGAIGLY
jgi:hypothetical protein